MRVILADVIGFALAHYTLQGVMRLLEIAFDIPRAMGTRTIFLITKAFRRPPGFNIGGYAIIREATSGEK